MAVGAWILTHKLLVSAIVGIGALSYLTFRNRSGPIDSVEIYLSPEDSVFRNNVIKKISEFERHLSTIVKTKIILGYSPDNTYGYISTTKTYRIYVSWVKRGPLGHGGNTYIDINYNAYESTIADYEFFNEVKFSQNEKEFLAANVLLHETVHSIYGHDSRLLRAISQHESTGLMVGWRLLDWFYPTFYGANPDATKGMLPFSEITQKRLRDAIKK